MSEICLFMTTSEERNMNAERRKEWVISVMTARGGVIGRTTLLDIMYSKGVERTAAYTILAAMRGANVIEERLVTPGHRELRLVPHKPVD
jgi:hypothetical protein